MRSELISHLDCRFRRGACDAHAEEECGDSSSRVFRSIPTSRLGFLELEVTKA